MNLITTIPKILFFLLLFISSLAASEALIVGAGSGSFTVAGGGDHPQKEIDIYYHKPVNFNKNSQVLFVVPGGGRNSSDYRDSWIEVSEKHNVVILSPSYSQADYPNFWNYNLGGMIDEVKINGNGIKLDSYLIIRDYSKWIFADFSRIFDLVVSDLGLVAKRYDMFGHSAGAQVLHRFVLFGQDSKAERIIAANAGSYTVPYFEQVFPYGLRNSEIGIDYQRVFSSRLTILLGSLDNKNMGKGLIRSDLHDVQGTNRLARGQFFFNRSQEIATKLNVDFNWQTSRINGVGHDYKKMGEAASKILYGE